MIYRIVGKRKYNFEYNTKHGVAMSLSLREKIINKLRDDITYGKLSPGERLVESKLVEEFKTSRTPIREALRQLQSEGTIEFERNKGITVSKMSVKQVDEIYSLRALLEGYAVRLSAEKIRKNDLLYLKDLQQKLKVAAKDYDLKSWLHNNNLFHRFFPAHSGNENLQQILDQLLRRTYRYCYIVVSIPGHFKRYLEDHEEILRAYEKGDLEAAEQCTRDHMQRIKDLLVDYLYKSPLGY